MSYGKAMGNGAGEHHRGVEGRNHCEQITYNNKGCWTCHFKRSLLSNYGLVFHPRASHQCSEKGDTLALKKGKNKNA